MRSLTLAFTCAVLCGCISDDVELPLCPAPKSLQEQCKDKPFGNDCDDYRTLDQGIASALEQCMAKDGPLPVSLLACDDDTQAVIIGDGNSGAVYGFDKEDQLSDLTTYSDAFYACRPRESAPLDAGTLTYCASCSLCGTLRDPACDGAAADKLIAQCLASPPKIAKGVEQCACTKLYPFMVLHPSVLDSLQLETEIDLRCRHASSSDDAGAAEDADGG